MEHGDGHLVAAVAAAVAVEAMLLLLLILDVEIWNHHRSHLLRHPYCRSECC
jgi:hypothetical protein